MTSGRWTLGSYGRGAVSNEQLLGPTRREELLRAAAEQFRSRGYHGASVDEIGASLGLSGPAMYHHVQSKEHLAAELMSGLLDKLLQVTPGQDAEHLATATLVAMRHRAQLTLLVRDLEKIENRDQILRQLSLLSDRWLGKTLASVASDKCELLRAIASGGALIGAARAHGTIAPQRLGMIGAELLTSIRDTALPPPVEGVTGRVDGSRGWSQSSRKEAIFDSAVDLIGAQGFRSVTMRQIAQRVGISASAIYRHFPNKAAILSLAITRAGERALADLNQAIREASGPEDALRRMVGGYVTICVADRNLMLVAATEGAYLPAEDKAVRRIRQQTLISEWTQCLHAIRPDIPMNEAVARVEAVTAMTTECIRSPNTRARHDLVTELLRFSNAILLPAVPRESREAMKPPR